MSVHHSEIRIVWLGFRLTQWACYSRLQHLNTLTQSSFGAHRIVTGLIQIQDTDFKDQGQMLFDDHDSIKNIVILV
jgi:hypothetical protein